MDPINDPARVRDEYETEDRFLARRLAAWADLRGPLVEDAAVEAVREGRPSHVLEVGCGTGDFTARVRDAVAAELVALDPSRRMVELTRARGIPAVAGDAQAVAFADGVFDCVLANRVLYHLPDLDAGLAEIARVLRPGGRLVAGTYAMDHLGELFDGLGGSQIGATFAAETGAAPLAAHFDPPERRDIVGPAVFQSRDELVRFLDASGGSFTGSGLASRLGDVEIPFTATYRHCVFVAYKPA